MGWGFRVTREKGRRPLLTQSWSGAGSPAAGYALFPVSAEAGWSSPRPGQPWGGGDRGESLVSGPRSNLLPLEPTLSTGAHRPSQPPQALLSRTLSPFPDHNASGLHLAILIPRGPQGTQA